MDGLDILERRDALVFLSAMKGVNLWRLQRSRLHFSWKGWIIITFSPFSVSNYIHKFFISIYIVYKIDWFCEIFNANIRFFRETKNLCKSLCKFRPSKFSSKQRKNCQNDGSGICKGFYKSFCKTFWFDGKISSNWRELYSLSLLRMHFELNHLSLDI